MEANELTKETSLLEARLSVMTALMLTMPLLFAGFIDFFEKILFFIGPESDHWQCLSLTDSLTDCRLVNLMDVTLACQDAYSKLVEVVTVAGVSDEDCVGNSLLHIWKLRFGRKANFLSRL